MWIFAGLYFVSAILMIFMKLPGEEKQNKSSYSPEKQVG
ncbi:hypothetical protein M1D53_19105 [Bacillus sp. PK9-021]